jgi:LEA14-like dessication related protein
LNDYLFQNQTDEYMKKSLTILIISLLLTSCAALRDYTDIREPVVQFSDMSIQNITFDGVTLLFDFDVTNPNRFNVNAEQYSYEFFINEQSFISGIQESPLRINSEATSTIQVPVTLNFQEVYQTFSSLLRQDQMAYQLSTEVEFDLPVAGRKKVPVSTSGEIPIPRVPRIDFGGFNLKEVSLTGAEVEVSFRVANPNRFGISLNNADYNLRVNGREWLDTSLGESIRVEASENREITIPIRLNAAQMGSALMDMMAGRTTFNYELTGSAEVSADLEGFPAGQLIPFELSGRYTLD